MNWQLPDLLVLLINFVLEALFVTPTLNNVGVQPNMTFVETRAHILMQLNGQLLETHVRMIESVEVAPNVEKRDVHVAKELIRVQDIVAGWVS